MGNPLDIQTLRLQNERYRGTGGVSDANRSLGFQPAFLDTETGEIHRACFGNGQPAPFHILDGLPSTLIRERDGGGRACAANESIIAGFLWEGRFMTRSEAAQALAA